jgi:hypothetical protein
MLPAANPGDPVVGTTELPVSLPPTVAILLSSRLPGGGQFLCHRFCLAGLFSFAFLDGH